MTVATGEDHKRQSMARKLTVFVAMSSAIEDELLSYGVAAERIAKIPMGVDAEVFKPLQNELEKKKLQAQLNLENVPTLLFVGTLVRRKRPDLLLKSVHLLKKMGYEIQVLFCGPETDGEYVAEMKEYANSVGIAEQVKWMGFQVDCSPFYKVSDYFCLPSSNEGMSAALIEAMASGVVPIVTPISGSRDVVTDGVNGRHVSEDENEIADVIKHYLSFPDTAIEHSKNSLARVEEQYTNESVYNQYLNLYRRIASGRDARG